MSRYLPFIAQEICNRPLGVTEAHAAMVVSALEGRLGIAELASFHGEFETMDRGDMQMLAEVGRANARAREANNKTSRQKIKVRGDGAPYELTATGIAVIPIKGTLVRNTGTIGPYSGQTGYDGIMAQLVHAIENPQVKAIWLDQNSPGGVVDGAFDLAQAIYANNEKNGGKPIWAMAADFSASCSYLMSSAADRVMVPRTGQVGSIGVVIIHAEQSAKLEREGVRATVFRSKERKMRGNSLEPLDDETAQQLQAMVDATDQIFVDHVAAFRGISKKSVHETRGSVYMGDQALAAGLVDEVISEPEAWMKLERKIARK